MNSQINRDLILLIRRLDEKAKLPLRGTNESAGLDIFAFLLSETGRETTLQIGPRQTRLVDTKIAVRPPPNHLVLVCSRSGLAQQSLFVTNSPGVVDPDYTGEIKVMLYNGSYETQWIKHEQRIAQLLVVPFLFANIREVSSLPSTSRGDKGWGSTGV